MGRQTRLRMTVHVIPKVEDPKGIYVTRWRPTSILLHLRAELQEGLGSQEKLLPEHSAVCAGWRRLEGTQPACGESGSSDLVSHSTKGALNGARHRDCRCA